MTVQTMEIKGKRFVILPEAEYRRLAANDDLPPLPAARADGSVPAIAFMRASIARGLIRDRRKAGLSQQQLGALSGVRAETISRIESGKHTPTVRVIDKLDAAIRKAGNGRKWERKEK